MSNLRIIYDNAAERATLAVSSTAGALAATYLLTEKKTDVWRSTSTSASITLTWSTAEAISAVVLPYCNLTPAATIRVRGYTAPADATPAFDTSAVLACPAATIKVRQWAGLGAGANSFAYGGGSCARIWFESAAVRKVVVDLVDSGNPDGYIEAAALVAGGYWSPVRNPDYGATLTPVDGSQNYRADSGNLMSDAGTQSMKLTMTLSQMDAADRKALLAIFRRNGIVYPMFISLMPGVADAELERDHQIYGKLSQLSGTTIANWNQYSAPIEIDSI